VGVTGGDVGTFDRAAGKATANTRMTLKDRFFVGSVTKTFTATVILELVDQGKLHLGDPISKWEPVIPHAKQITIKMLLDMRSGIWDECGPGSSLSAWVGRNCLKAPAADCEKYWTPQALINLAVLDTLKKGPAAPRGAYYYSDTNYMLLALIAQKRMHEPFGKLLEQYVLDPLHMTHTVFATRRLTTPKPATVGHIPGATPTSYVPGPVPSPSIAFGAGNIITTLGDLQIWARALGTGALLTPRTQRERLDVLQVADSGALPLANTGLTTALPLAYGLGIASFGGMLGHNGELAPPGYTAELWYVPKSHGTVVLLLNSVTECGIGDAPAGLLSDATAASLAQIAFPRALNRTQAAAVTCPLSSGNAGGLTGPDLN
jgi:D-alanyl-D-alanine carboxypeptidase